MFIKSLKLSNVRNHNETTAQFSPGLNIIHGLNGVGKTSLLEAIALCSLSKTFLPVPDAALINKFKDFLFVRCDAENSIGVDYFVKVQYPKGQKKTFSNSYGDNQLPKNIIGEMPVVILSPDYKTLTFGAPDDRRQFLNTILSQSSKRYIDLALKNKKYLKQRNKILSDKKQNQRIDMNLLQILTDMFIESSAEIIMARDAFIRQFEVYFKRVYSEITNNKENVALKYSPFGLSGLDLDKETIIEKYKDDFIDNLEDEFRRGTTIFGPQKDDLKIFINEGLSKQYASQGQHKSLLISLKFAEFFFLHDAKKETPIILLDDIFSELDEERSEKVLEYIRTNNAQTFITVTNAEYINKFVNASDNCFYFHVSEGEIKGVQK